VGYPAFKGEASGVKGLALSPFFPLGHGLYLGQHARICNLHVYLFKLFSSSPEGQVFGYKSRSLKIL